MARIELGWTYHEFRTLAVALSLSGVLFVCLTGLLKEETTQPTLLGQSFSSFRPLKGRLTGGFQHVKPGRSRVLHLNKKQILAIRAINQELARQPSSRSLADAAFAELITGRQAGATTLMRKAIERDPANSSLYSDLSAILLSGPIVRPIDLVEALASADRAIRLEPRLEEAHFNRSLALESLYLLHSAIDSWEYYLSLDKESEWSEEARLRLDVLRETTRRSGTKTLDRLRYAVQLNSSDVAEEIQLLPEAGYRLFDELLATWVAACNSGDHEQAQALLEKMKLVSSGIAKIGDLLPEDVIASVGITQQGSGLHHNLVGYAAYVDALRLFRNEEYVQAARLFADATKHLRLEGNPLWLVAQVNLAICEYYTPDYEAATRRLIKAERELVAHQYPTLEGRINWLLGLIAFESGSPGLALGRYERAMSLYLVTGNQENQAAIESLMATVFSYLGDHDVSWRHRLSAMSLSPAIITPRRLQNVLDLAGESAIYLRAPEAALYFHHEAIEAAQNSRRPLEQAVAFLRRGQVYFDLGDLVNAELDIKRAYLWVAHIVDPNLRSSVHADITLMQGRIEKNREPLKAAIHLTKVLDFYRATNYRFLLPLVLQERGLAYLESGREREYEEDLTAAIEEHERLRRAVGSPDLGMLYFDQVRPAFDRMIVHQLEQGRPRQAFEYAGRARATLLRDTAPSAQAAGVSVREIQGRLDSKTAMVVYALAGDSLVIWVVKSNSFGWVRQKIHTLRLRRLVEKTVLAASTGDREEASQAGLMSLYDLLVLPIVQQIRGASRLVFVPDQFLLSLPLSALMDRRSGRYLVESFEIMLAPSVALCSDCIGSRLTPPMENSFSILIAAKPGFSRNLFPTLSNLRGSGIEASRLRAIYGDRAELLTGPDATRTAFLEGVKRHQVIHFSGHALLNPEFPERSALLLAPEEENQTGLLSVEDLRLVSVEHVKLVVLAACQTGGGRISATEGILGFANLLLRRGVQDVVTTLWPIDDDVGVLFGDSFHRLVRKGDAAGALRETQLNLLSIDRFRAPRYWAAYRLTSSY